MDADMTRAPAEEATTWLDRLVAGERGRFVIWLPVFMAAGVVLYGALRTEPPGWAGAAAGLAALLAIRLSGSIVVRSAAAAMVALALGLASAQFAAWRAPLLLDLPTRAVVLTGTVRAVEQLPQGRRILLESARWDGGDPLPRTLRIRLKQGDETPLATGDIARVRAMLSRPPPPAYPGAWDSQRDAFFAGTGGFGFALNPAERLVESHPTGLAPRLQRLRETIIARIDATLAGPRAAIAATLLTGGTASITEPDRAAFRDSGLAHLLAIAGLHIGIVMAWSFGATRLALALHERAALSWPLKPIAAIAALLAGGFYMVLTGAHVPILRSFAMAALVTLGVIVGRRAMSLRGLAIAMAVLVLMAPNEVLGVSFQMSFSAVLALVAGYEALRPWLLRLKGEGGAARWLLGHLAALALTSALAGTASAPYGAYHFGHIQLYYVAANMLAVPLTALWVMPAGMLALALMPLGLEAPVLHFMGWGIEWILAIGRAVSAWPAAVLAVPPMPPWGLAAVSIGIAWLGIWRTGWRLAGLPLIALGLLSPLTLTPPDALVSADARLIALRTHPTPVYQQTAGGGRFTLDAWRQYWAIDTIARLPTRDGAIDTTLCDPTGCRTTIRGQRVTIQRAGEDCAAALLLAATPLRLSCPTPPPAIDRFSVWREGAHAVWLTPSGPRILTDRAHRGQRPWMPSPQRASIPPGLPAAATETLPDD